MSEAPARRAPEALLASSPSAAAVTEVSVVLPCLDEAATIATCITKARAALDALGLNGEVVVGDNGSRDGSPVLARRLGARVIDVPSRGYGACLRAAIQASRGRLVVMADADDSYDLGGLGPFVERLGQGYDLVVGNRFAGGIEQDAMPWLNRHVGNPLLSAIGRLLFGTGVGDFHSGMRGLSRAAFDRLGLESDGMEFASEMVARAQLLGMRVAEVPITLHKDGRGRRSHLRPVRDGLRHLRLMARLALTQSRTPATRRPLQPHHERGATDDVLAARTADSARQRT